MKKSAFTLIELLVVISIIAILAGIALPVFSAALERGRAAKDMSNLRQLGIGTVAYLSDNNDQIFSAANTTTSWPATLYGKYITNWLVFLSPFDTRTDPAGAPVIGTGVPCSYGINPNILNQTASAKGSATPAFTGNATTFTTPSQLVYMAPNINTGGGSAVTFPTSSTADQNVALVIPTNASSTMGTHARRSQINVLYADSHVSSITYLSFSTTGSPNYQWQPIVPPSATSL